jgi:probable F420-dependent oxidoreductase
MAGHQVKCSIALPTDHVSRPDEFVTGDAVMEIAAAIEAAGLDACFVTDHPAPDAKWLGAGGHHALEPTVALSFAAAATTSLAVHTHIYVLAYRNPFLAAKAIASLDQLSGGRSIIGIGPGYLRAEFDALGVDFEQRVELTDEAVDVMRRLWDGETVAGESKHWSARGVEQRPVLDRQPTLWFGGNSRRSIERAARVGQGWSPFPTAPSLARTTRTASIESLDDLAPRIELLRELCEREGRTEPVDVCFSGFAGYAYGSDPTQVGPVVDELGAMAEMGVTWVTVGFEASTRAQMIERIQRFAEEVAAQL